MKYAKDKDGEIHAVNPANGEYTLCGNAFEGGFDDELGKEGTRSWESIPDGIITCPHCKYIIKVIKNENYKMF